MKYSQNLLEQPSINMQFNQLFVKCSISKQSGSMCSHQLLQLLVIVRLLCRLFADIIYSCMTESLKD